MSDLNASQIYDNYNKASHYLKLLAIPGRTVQSREFNEIQSLFLDIVKRLGDTLFKDGNVISGCGIHVGEDSVTIEPGKIYLEGVIHDTNGGKVPISGVGEERIGVKLSTTIVTEADDESLLDPAVGFVNYLHPGCYRRKIELEFTCNDDESATVVTLINGEILNLVSERPQADSIQEILARRTFDESGNYVVEGFEILDAKYSTDEKIILGLSAGKAYVRGYEIAKPLDTTFEIKRCTATKSIVGEGNVVSSSHNRYKIYNSPVKTIDRVFVTAAQTDVITRGSIPNTSDTLTRSAILGVTQVKQGSVIYYVNKDFKVVGNKIDWSLNGAEPQGGTNYTVEYRYKTNLNENQYTVEVGEDGFSYISLQSNAVVVGTEFYIDYTYYVSRKDSIGIDRHGNIIVVEGVPADVSQVVAPVITDNSILLLGSVCALPNSSDCLIINNTVRVSKMNKIQNTIKRVEDLEYNMAITDLDNEAMEGESLTSMRGVFTDGFLNFNKIDQTHDDTKLALDIEAGILTMPYNEFLSQLSPSTSATNNFVRLGNVYSCNYTEVLEFEQPYRTRTMAVNPYQVFEPAISISINPSVDTWVDTSYMEVDKVITSKVNLLTWWNKAKNSWSGNEQKLWEELGMSGKVPDNLNWTSFTSSRWGSIWGWNGTSYTLTGTGQNKVLDSATMYMRQREVKVTCKTFENNEDNIKVMFDGRICPLTPLGTTTKGTQAGSVRADATGKVEAKFTVPNKVPCGTKEVKLFSPKYTGITSYSANGRNVVIENVVYTVNYQTQVWDPLAQTFQLDTTCNITSVDIFVAEKDGDYPITVQLRKTSNAYPSNEVLAEKVILASDIKVSSRGDVATKVTFDNIVLCEKDTQYAIVILTDSPKIKVHVAALGDKDDVSGKYMTFNPYTAGILFSSSNALAWTPHQDMDLKFRLYRAKYEPSGSVQFNQVSTTKADRLMIALDHLQPANTQVKFLVSVNHGDWLPFYPWLDQYYTENIQTVDIKVDFTSNEYRSPVILADTSMLAYWYNELDGVYVTRNLELPEGFNDIKVMLDTARLPGVTYKVYYATDKVGSDWKELTSKTSSVISDVWEELNYTLKLDGNAYDLRLKIEMLTENSWDAPAVRRFRCLTSHTV